MNPIKKFNSDQGEPVIVNPNIDQPKAKVSVELPIDVIINIFSFLSGPNHHVINPETLILRSVSKQFDESACLICPVLQVITQLFRHNGNGFIVNPDFKLNIPNGWKWTLKDASYLLKVCESEVKNIFTNVFEKDMEKIKTDLDFYSLNEIQLFSTTKNLKEQVERIKFFSPLNEMTRLLCSFKNCLRIFSKAQDFQFDSEQYILGILESKLKEYVQKKIIKEDDYHEFKCATLINESRDKYIKENKLTNLIGIQFYRGEYFSSFYDDSVNDFITNLTSLNGTDISSELIELTKSKVLKFASTIKKIEIENKDLYLKVFGENFANELFDVCATQEKIKIYASIFRFRDYDELLPLIVKIFIESYNNLNQWRDEVSDNYSHIINKGFHYLRNNSTDYDEEIDCDNLFQFYEEFLFDYSESESFSINKFFRSALKLNPLAFCLFNINDTKMAELFRDEAFANFITDEYLKGFDGDTLLHRKYKDDIEVLLIRIKRFRDEALATLKK